MGSSLYKHVHGDVVMDTSAFMVTGVEYPAQCFMLDTIRCILCNKGFILVCDVNIKQPVCLVTELGNLV